MPDAPKPGTIGWIDITVDDANSLRDFYAAVAGWHPEPVEMEGGYADWTMNGPGGTAVTGICHRKGENADVPAGWLMYVVVEDIESAIAAATSQGGALLRQSGPMAFLRDPAGNAFALWQAEESEAPE